MGHDTNSGFEKLNDSNYGPWKKLLKALLIRKGLWEVVSGDETLPSGSPNTKPVRAFRKRQAEAGAEIILHVEPSQLPFIEDDDPKVVWDALAAMHQARGMATRLTVRRTFWKLEKGDLTIQAFISEARRLANQLKDIGVTVDEEDIILVLTGGLPPSYDNFVVSLDSTPPADLTLDYVITRLLNEEARQLGTVPTAETSERRNVAFAAAQAKRNLAFITCFNCQKKGHFANDCPEKKTETAAANTAIDLGSESDDYDGVW
jgi:hypothetical protein